MNINANSIKEYLALSSLHLVEKALLGLPEGMVMPWVENRVNRGIRHPEGAKFINKVVHELLTQWPRFAPNVKKRFIENLFGHEMLLSGQKRKDSVAMYGRAPLLMVISPTMRCNLKCHGCYSANYNKEDAINSATLDRIMYEAKDLGLYFVVVSGGEPFLRDDLLRMFEKHPEMLFMVYTNGTIIHKEKLAKDIARLGNCIPCISVEGFADETEKRRGKGTFERIVGAMDALREAGVMFGFSATPMRQNNELLVSDEFVEYYTNLGCFIGWYFSYMPVGREPDLDLMPTPDQRAFRMKRMHEIREKFPLVAADFWCDGAMCGGCLSSGRIYFHINAQGGIEPCVFHQFSVDNVLEKSLKEALNSEYFRFLREKIDTIDNRYTPCPIIDHPQILREAVSKHSPLPSQKGVEKTVTDLSEGLDQYSEKLNKIMDPLWKESME